MWRGRAGELFEVPKPAGGPFGEEPEAWWRPKAGGAPKHYTVPLGLVSGIVVLAGSGAHGAAKLLILPFALGVPVVFVDRWWRGRTRREQERVLPEDQQPDR